MEVDNEPNVVSRFSPPLVSGKGWPDRFPVVVPYCSMTCGKTAAYLNMRARRKGRKLGVHVPRLFPLLVTLFLLLWMRDCTRHRVFMSNGRFGYTGGKCL